MIEILDFEKDLFDNLTLKKQLITNNTYVTTKKLAAELLIRELPIIDRRKAMIRIFNFLNYVDVNCEDDDTMFISKYKLEEYFTRKKYVKYLELLSHLKIIYRVKHNGVYYKFNSDGEERGTHCIKYKLNKTYKNDNELALVILEEETKKDIDFKCNIADLDHRYINTIKKIDLNIPSAIMAEIDHWKQRGKPLNVLRKRISKILSTLRNRYIKKGIKVNRIYHSFSNLSKISREHFKVKFYDLDIVNSQPLFLVAYLKDNNMGLDINYQDDCESGLFYNRFYDLSKNEDEFEIRKEVKQYLYKTIYFGFFESNKHNKRFKHLYPKTWDSLFKISQTNISLASRLQNMEARLFNNLAPRYSKHYYTLFDAVYFSNSADKILLRKEIDEFFKNLYIKVKIK